MPDSLCYPQRGQTYEKVYLAADVSDAGRVLQQYRSNSDSMGYLQKSALGCSYKRMHGA